MASHTQKKVSRPIGVVRAITHFFTGLPIEREGLCSTHPNRICFKKEEPVHVQPESRGIRAAIGKTFVGKHVEFVDGAGFRTNVSNEKIPYDIIQGFHIAERAATKEETGQLRNAIEIEGRNEVKIRTFVAEHWKAMGFETCPFQSNA